MGRHLAFTAPDISGDIVLAKSSSAHMAIVTPFAGRPRHFYYNLKINCMPALGQVTAFGKTYDFAPETDFGVLDWGRGAWTYDNTWYWGSASVLVDRPNGRRPFGFNIGHGFGDTSAGTENMQIGRAHV